jgi:hypothetical protein
LLTAHDSKLLRQINSRILPRAMLRATTDLGTMPIDSLATSKPPRYTAISSRCIYAEASRGGTSLMLVD